MSYVSGMVYVVCSFLVKTHDSKRKLLSSLSCTKFTIGR